jgi:prevent-host-death family protein
MYNSTVHFKESAMQTLPFSEARAQLANALRSVEAGNEPFSISRRGQVAGVLMSFEQYQRMSGAATGFAERLQHWRCEQLPALNGISEDDPFAQVRQTDKEREFSW